jgi:hypothetical protein
MMSMPLTMNAAPRETSFVRSNFFFDLQAVTLPGIGTEGFDP